MLVPSIFSTKNPFLARLFHFWQQAMVTLKPYSFTAEWNPLAANAVGAQPTTAMTIDTQIDILLLQMQFVAYYTTGPQNTALSTPNMLLNITEKSGANLFSDTDHPVSFWTGNAQSGAQSYDLPFPRLIVGNNQILPKLTDNGGTPARCWLGFECLRVTYVNTSRSEVFPGILF